MASQGARVDLVASKEESGESVEGLVAPASAGGVQIVERVLMLMFQFLPVVLQWWSYHQSMHGSFRWPSRPKLKPKHSYLHRRMHPFQRQCQHQHQ
ncbi:UNVERIFIED_CONTAM: hypothetical protein Sradi_2977300 [Sesamum radiatum]|uniref:Uncharacterized protein n=1 Tax=Sesamum radiatum TaxID=300843 RepID=A0AAW2S133_SESRA